MNFLLPEFGEKYFYVKVVVKLCRRYRVLRRDKTANFFFLIQTWSASVQLDSYPRKNYVMLSGISQWLKSLILQCRGKLQFPQKP